MFKVSIEESIQYEGLIHEWRQQWNVSGVTFGYNKFHAGPFQTRKEAEQLAKFLTTTKEAQS